MTDLERLSLEVVQYRDRYEQFGADEGAKALTVVLELVDALQANATGDRATDAADHSDRTPTG